MASFVDAAGIDFADKVKTFNKVDGLESQVTVPSLILSEISVAVVHHNLVGVTNDGGSVAFQHGILLVEVSADTSADVISKDMSQPVVVSLISRAVNHP